MDKLASAALLLALLAIAAEAAPCTSNWANTLYPCLGATNSGGTPPAQCCQSLANTYLHRPPSCLCDDMLTAHQVLSFNIQNALSIPNRCGYGSQVPKGYKCGNYVVGH